MGSPGVPLSFGLFIAALVVAVLGGFGSGSLLAMLLAAGGACVGGYGVWQGMQEEKQTGAALSILGLLANLALAGLMLILKVISWL